MPTYEYRCDACDHEFELFQTMSAPVKRKCPECAKLKLLRLIGTGSAVIFKGSGFYETDYRSKSYKDGEQKAKKAAEPKAEPKPDSKSDPKPAKKSEKPAKKPDAKAKKPSK